MQNAEGVTRFSNEAVKNQQIKLRMPDDMDCKAGEALFPK